MQHSQLRHWNFIPQIKGKLNQFLEIFSLKYTPLTNNGSFLNKNYYQSIISFDYFTVFSNCFYYQNAFLEYS